MRTVFTAAEVCLQGASCGDVSYPKAVGCALSDEAREILAKGKLSTLVRRTTADERRDNGSIVEAIHETAREADVVVATLRAALPVSGLDLADR